MFTRPAHCLAQLTLASSRKSHKIVLKKNLPNAMWPFLSVSL